MYVYSNPGPVDRLHSFLRQCDFVQCFELTSRNQVNIHIFFMASDLRTLVIDLIYLSCFDTFMFHFN